jgi:predicted GIY-YIG superfamily endonuclease
MKYVYLLDSITHPRQRYIGLTTNLDARLAAHNAGQSPRTAKYRPWNLIAAVQFTDDEKAAAFERYLKTGSGFAFANRHFY